MEAHHQHRACCLLGLVAALLLLGASAAAAAAADPAVDVCPANSLHKSLPFLKAAKPGALSTLLGPDGLSINMAAITDFIKTTLVPMIGANVFFFALAAVMLLIFIIWRSFRWCCVVCCCRGSCDLKRAKNDAGEVLFGKRMKVNKGFMFLFGLVAVAFAAYGMATVDKSVTEGAFNVLTSISTYANKAFDTLDDLLDTIAGTSDIITKFQEVVLIDINVDAITTNLTVIGSFLDNAPSPTQLLTAVTALTTRVDPDLKNALTSLNTGLASFAAYSWSTTFNTIQNSGSSGTNHINAMKVKADNLQTAITNLGTPTPTNGQVDALNTAVTAMHDDFSISPAVTHWVTGSGKLANIKAALQDIDATNPMSDLRTRLASVQAIATDIRTAKTNNVKALINSLVTEYAVVEPAMAGLLQKLVDINATILVLPAAMQVAYTTLADAKAQLDTTMNTPPTPAQLMANLTSFQTQLPDPADLDPLITSLTAAETALHTAFPTGSNDAYVAWMDTLTAAITSTVTSTLAMGPLGQLQTAVVAYVGAGYTGWPAVQTKLTTFQTSSFTTLVGATGFGDAAAITRVNTYSATAAVAPVPSIPGGQQANAQTYATSANAELNKGYLASLSTTFASSMVGVDAAYGTMGSPPSAVVTQPKQLLQDIKTAAVTNGNSVKDQVDTTVSTFRGSTAGIKSMVVTQLNDIRDQYQEPAKLYDGYRYTASMGLYGVSILFVILVLGSCLVNYQWGTNVSTLLLFIIAVLYFLLALIIALLISALFMGCNELEPLAVRLAPAQMTPLLRHYFYSEGDSVEAVLKDANLVDIGAVRTQFTDSKDDVLSGLTGSFTWVNNPANPRNPYQLIGRINSTIDTALTHANSLVGLANRTQLFGVYSEVKGYVCCAVPDMVAPMWVGLTFAGIFALAMLFATLWYLGKLDTVPRRDCCGCSCHTRTKYAGTVVPGGNGEQLPQYAEQSGWEQPLGPYAMAAPNGAMAMHSQWVPLDEQHATVNVVLGGTPKAKAG